MAEEQVTTAMTQARSDVAQEAAKVRDGAQQKADRLRSQTEAGYAVLNAAIARLDAAAAAGG